MFISFALVMLGICTPVASAQSGAVRLDTVVTGLTSPVYVTHARDGSNRLFIVEQPGRIKVLPSGSSTPNSFLDIGAKVKFGGEQGLLGLAFHPAFAANSRFFVNYTRQPDGATVVAEYRASADPVATASSETILLTIAQPFSNHNGGMIEFGPDGYLYIGMGDGGSANDPGRRAQNVNDLLGKVLRIDVDRPANGVPYSSPPDNPFFGAVDGRDEIFALGLRNPFRFSFDRQTGQLYAGDVGQGLLEEVDIVTAGGNYGWRVYEGLSCTNLDPQLCVPGNYAAPIFQYDHSGGRCSITGGYIYRGRSGALPSGTYVFGDFCSGEIFSLDRGVQSPLLVTDLNISSFGEDEAGEIYVVGIGGTVRKLVATSLPAFAGYHDLADCSRIAGWAWDSSRPNTPISVDLYSDDARVATVLADVLRPDVRDAGKGDGIHGFDVITPASLKDGQPHSITVKFAGTATDLSQTPKTIACAGGGAAPSYDGFHDVASCSQIVGWAWDSSRPNTPIGVDIYSDGARILTVLADALRPDVRDAGKGDGVHGFTIVTPASLKDGQAHSIAVKFAGTATDLSQTPKTIACAGGGVAPPSFKGYHDVASCSQIAGWAWDSNRPDTPISVDIYSDDAPIATVLADVLRPDVRDAGKGNGVHGFILNTPASLRDNRPHSITVKFAQTQTDLSTTPKALSCAPG
ncbi:MAG: PQQ-dependent sugar dehydrogenase [Casimicrobiaceae bacterium]